MKFQFKKHKYGREILIDCERMSDVNHFTKDHTPFLVDFHEILILTSGKGVFRLDNEIINFKKGTILLLPPNKWRQWSKIEEKIDGYFLIFEEAFISKFFSDQLFLYRFHYFYNNTSPSYIQLHENKFQDFIAKLQEVRYELQNFSADSEHFLRALLYYILIQINRIYKDQFQIKGQFFENNLTLRFKKIMEQKIRSFHNVSDYATFLQVSKSHLNTILKKHLGKSTAEIIKDRLIAEAKRELLYSNASIAEISYALNFSDPSNFNRFFKEQVKLTPKAFRQTNSK